MDLARASPSVPTVHNVVDIAHHRDTHNTFPFAFPFVSTYVRRSHVSSFHTYMAPATHRHAMSFPLFSVSTKMKFLSGFVLLRSFLLQFSRTLQRPLHLAFSWLGLWLTVERAIRFATNKIWHPCWAAYTNRLYLRFWIHTTYTTGIARYAPQIPPCVLYVQVGSGADRFLAERAERTARVRVQNTRGKFSANQKRDSHPLTSQATRYS